MASQVKRVANQEVQIAEESDSDVESLLDFFMEDGEVAEGKKDA